jgi:AhpD family alkylhydroperoxidase
MAQDLTPLMPIVSDEDASPRVKKVFDDIRETRQTDFINNFWRVVANDPANLERTWDEVKSVMAPGALDSLIKDLIYVAVSTNNSCTYCVRSHTASARAKGATDEMLAEVHAVVAAANRTNRLAIGLQVPVDAAFA